MCPEKIASEHSYAMTENSFNIDEFITIKPSGNCDIEKVNEVLSVPEVSLAEKSPLSDAGYESWGSPCNDLTDDFGDLLDSTFSDLFPDLL